MILTAFTSTTPALLLSLAIALLAGLLMSRVVKLIKLPAVTGYLIAGILIGPMVLGQLGINGLGMIEGEPKALEPLSQLALGFIAFAMGNEFRLAHLKSIGKQATIIGILQAVITAIVVDAALIGLHFILGPDVFPIEAAIVLGSIATATAPAATLMVVKQYKAKGPLTDMLLPVVALDDAVGLIVFAISFGVAKSIGTGNVDVLGVIVSPLLEIILSLSLGALLGLLFTLFEKFFHSRSKRMAVTVAFVMVAVGLTTIEFSPIPIGNNGLHIALSPLLTCMMLGSVFCNICDFSEELMARADRWTTPILILFFVISGAELSFNSFSNIAVVIIGITYIIFRSIGKISGATISAKATKCDKNIVKYLGITLLPQAGVALGMASTVSRSNIAGGNIVYDITLFAVLIYEIVGPFLTKISLEKSGDIDPTGRKSGRGVHPESENTSN
jgi:Kef-type K+ transport system membrane component KefB